MGVKRVLDKRVCCNCGSDTTWANKHGWACWNRTPNGWMCNKCYCRTVSAPKHNKIESLNPRRFRFGRMRLFKGSARVLTGRCSKCPNNIFDGSCKMTAMHHWYYLRISPMTCREELCQSCHSRLGPSFFGKNVRKNRPLLLQ
jgi:hypothetical protein